VAKLAIFGQGVFGVDVSVVSPISFSGPEAASESQRRILWLSAKDELSDYLARSKALCYIAFYSSNLIIPKKKLASQGFLKLPNIAFRRGTRFLSGQNMGAVARVN